MKENINKFLNLVKILCKILAVFNLILMIYDAYLGYYDWVIISGACALLLYFFSRIKIVLFPFSRSSITPTATASRTSSFGVLRILDTVALLAFASLLGKGNKKEKKKLYRCAVLKHEKIAVLRQQTIEYTINTNKR